MWYNLPLHWVLQFDLLLLLLHCVSDIQADSQIQTDWVAQAWLLVVNPAAVLQSWRRFWACVLVGRDAFGLV